MKQLNIFGIIKLFERVYKKRLGRAEVVKIEGLRTAIVDDPGRGRIRRTFLFKIFGRYF